MQQNVDKKPKLSMSEIRGITLVLIGLGTLVYYYSWWISEDQLTSPLLVIGLLFALIYGICQILGSWLLYLATHRRSYRASTAPQNFTVDVFVTSCGEKPELIEKSLRAAVNLLGEHKTWLLDDLGDPVLEKMAHKLGAKYLNRPDSIDAKAGNVNSALANTNGEIIVIFDIDHIPHPKFLMRTIRHFADPSVGFIQVMPTFSNNADSWVAQAAAETSLDFYNPTSKGMDALRSVTKMGTNSLVRRTALMSIGGYQPGLAEDLATSLKLHAEGWESVYVAEPLAPGLVPGDLTSWFTQQLKWSYGVFRILFTDFFSLFGKFNWGQRLSYTVRTTKYLLGLVTSIHIVLTIIFLLSESHIGKASFENYLIHLIPLAFADSAIRMLALRRWHYPRVESFHQRRAVALVYGTWPVYTLAFLMSLFRIPLRFRPTPKGQESINAIWLMPQIIAFCLLAYGLAFSLIDIDQPKYWFTLLFASIQAVIHLTFLWYSISSLNIRLKLDRAKSRQDIRHGFLNADSSGISHQRFSD